MPPVPPPPPVMSDVRNALADFLEVVDAAHLEVVARDRDDRDRDLLEILLTASGRDDDLLETFLSERGLIRQTSHARQSRHDSCVDLVDFHRTPNWKNESADDCDISDRPASNRDQTLWLSPNL